MTQFKLNAKQESFRDGARAFARELAITAETDRVDVSFTLPAGAYATVFLAELVGPGLRDQAFAADAEPSLR